MVGNGEATKTETPDGLTCLSDRVPGWDCRVRCDHPNKGNHGIGSEMWRYAVTDGEAALSLLVRSGQYPDTVTHADPENPTGSDLGLCCVWPTRSEHLGQEPAMCPWVGGGLCYDYGSSGLQAEAFFRTHGRARFDQGERFWSALVARFRRMKAVAERSRITSCPTCGGRGHV